MKKQYEIQIKLGIKSPFITSSGADAARGFNLIFSRDINGRLIMNSSHVKGKFREAMKELARLQEQAKIKILTNIPDIVDVYLGKENEKTFEMFLEFFKKNPNEDLSFYYRSFSFNRQSQIRKWVYMARNNLD